jgi:hypothetical protein
MTLRISVRRKCAKRSIHSLRYVNGTIGNALRSDPACSAAEMSRDPTLRFSELLGSARLHADGKLTFFLELEASRRLDRGPLYLCGADFVNVHR